jgi:polyhydroxyalkanoate synthesis regulator phasin
MPRPPLPQMANQMANQAVKGVLGTQVQKLIDTQVARATGPLLARIDELERRVAALEGKTDGAQRAHRSDDV